MSMLRPAHLLTALAGMVLLCFGVPSVVEAQETGFQQGTAYQMPKVKEYGQQGVPKMTLYVWGNADSGVWRVDEGTDLLEFLSVVSRVQMVERSADRRLIQTLNIYRNGERVEGDPFFEARIQNLFGRQTSYPELQEGDILVLETEARNRFTWRDIARVAGMVATVLNTFLIIQRLR